MQRGITRSAAVLFGERTRLACCRWRLQRLLGGIKKVFRRGAEMGTRGACAPESIATVKVAHHAKHHHHVKVVRSIAFKLVTFVNMRILTTALISLPLVPLAAENTSAPTFDAAAAERFGKLALACVHKEYPNKISHVLNSDADVAPPRKLTPAFCGCYDWHSSVHGHWLLVRLVRTCPDWPLAPTARPALKNSLTAENLKEEANYLRGKGRT